MHVAPAPDFGEALSEIGSDGLLKVVQASASVGEEPEYIHWDKLRHLDPPDGLSHREWWLAIKLNRRPLLRRLPLIDDEGEAFFYATPDAVLRLLHQVDQRCAGEIAMPAVVTTEDQARQHYLVNSLMEEAIRSSQLEGATTSRRVAKELLRTGREPKDRSERMILNNYLALQFMRDEIGEELTPGLVLELQRILTQDTLDNPDAAGRLQVPGEDRVAVLDRADGSLIHKPPPAEQLPERLRALCDFGNERDDPETFLHPVIRAILLHFWLGYDHPFEDGNGRTARALFYWYMRARGYWLVEYLSISSILQQAPSQYTRAFLFTETDERDTTYFILYQLNVIQRAVDRLHEYLGRKIKEVRDVESLLKTSAKFSHRQLALLSGAIRNPAMIFTFQSHAATHGVTHETARTDLVQLSKRGFLIRRRAGRRHVFTPAPGLPDLIRGSS